VPVERGRVRPHCGLVREDQRLAFDGAVRAPVVEVQLQPVTDDEAVVLVHRHVAAIKQAVEIGAEREAVGHAVLAADRVRLDVRRFENRQGMLLRHGARAAVRIEDLDAEDPLSEPRQLKDEVP